MDPNKTLADMIGLAESLVNGSWRYMSDQEIDASHLAESVLAMHKWLTKGGFLPKAWQRTNGPISIEEQDYKEMWFDQNGGEG